MVTKLCDTDQQMSGCLGPAGGMGQVERGLPMATEETGDLEVMGMLS